MRSWRSAASRSHASSGDVGYCLSVRREPLDFILLQRARAAATVEVVEGAQVSDVLWDRDRAAGVALRDGRRARSTGGAGERAAMTTYHRRRDAHALPAYHDALRGAADLRTLVA